MAQWLVLVVESPSPSPPPQMLIPQGSEGGGTGGAVGGLVTTRSMTAPAGGAPLQVAPEGLGPEGVSGEGAVPGVVCGAGWTSNQLQQRKLRVLTWTGL